MKPQTPGRGFFYALILEETGKLHLIAGPVYSNFPGPGRFLFWGVYKILEKTGPRQNLYTQKFRVWAGSCSGAYTESSKNQGPGQDQYTQIFRARVGSRLMAYTRYSKKLGPGQICILKNSGSGQVPAHWRIQKARRVRVWTESVYSNFSGPGRFLIAGVYLYTQKARTLGEICILKNSGPGQVLG